MKTYDFTDMLSMGISNQQFKYLATGLVFLFASCKKGVPEFQTINKLSAFTVDQSLIYSTSRTNIASFTVSGQCDSSINKIQLSFDNKSYDSIQNYSSSSSFTCTSNSRFTYTIDPTKSAQFVIPDSSNSKTIYVRGSGDLGFSQVYPVKIEVKSSGTDAFITGGTGSGTSVGAEEYKLKGRVQTSVINTSSGYTLKGSIKVQ